MGPLTGLLALPVAGPIGALSWLARQIGDAAQRQMLDPARIEAALLGLERRLESGDIDEAAFDAAEAELLEELAEMRRLRAELEADADGDSSDDGAPGDAIQPEGAHEEGSGESAAGLPETVA